MASRLYRGTLFALYQVTLMFGIMLLPVALVMRQFGFTLPIHRMVDRLGAAYENTTSESE
jgi:hypothetical protein